MVWNVHGAGGQGFLNVIKEVVRINRPTILALVETHISGEMATKVCNHIHFSGQFYYDAQGFSGGIWLFWKKEEISVTILDAHTQHIKIEILKAGTEQWVFSAIYASPDSTLRRDL